MDNRIRRNEICVVGLPRCDFVFSATRTCFIAYGFNESSLEMSILKKLLEARGIQPVEAGGSLAPGQNAFCAKICSKIITSQFCIVLMNNDEDNGAEIPNANVNMEYGLMLGFNKYVIPFQRESQKLPFNVAGLDTVKYANKDFERKAAEAIDQAVKSTQQEQMSPVDWNQVLDAFLLSKKTVVTPLDTDGDRNMFRFGQPLGFNLLNDFSGLNYIYFGNFTAVRPEVALWRLRTLREILDGRRASIDTQVKLGIVNAEHKPILDSLFGKFRIWLAVTSGEDKRLILEELQRAPIGYEVEIFSLADVETELAKLARPAS